MVEERSKDWIHIEEIWNYTFKLPNVSNLSLKGYSRGAEETSFCIPELKIFIDCGIITYKIPEKVFITHCHSDHTKALVHLITGVKHEKPIEIYVPIDSYDLFFDLVKSAYFLNRGTKENDRFQERRRLIKIKESDQIEIGKKMDYFVKPFKLDHTVPTMGYGIYRKTRKLKDEYRERSGIELSKIDDKFDFFEVPEVVFLFDTSITPLFENSELLTFKVMIIECTFFDDSKKSLRKAKETKHIHWNDLKPFVEMYPNIYFIITHFSMIYEMEYVNRFFDEYCIHNKIKNLKVWSNEFYKN